MIFISLIYYKMYEQQGYVLLCTKNITKHDIVNLCKMITVKYNQYFDTNYYFEPEAVTEGGIARYAKSDMVCKSNKSMRLYGGNWPHVYNAMEEWQHQTDICFNKNGLIRTHLKSNLFRWRQSEIDLFLSCFNKFGIIIHRPCMISAKSSLPKMSEPYENNIYKIFLIRQICCKLIDNIDIDVANKIKQLYNILNNNDYIDLYARNIHYLLNVDINHVKAQNARYAFHLSTLSNNESYKQQMIKQYSDISKDYIIKIINNICISNKYPDYYLNGSCFLIKKLY